MIVIARPASTRPADGPLPDGYKGNTSANVIAERVTFDVEATIKGDAAEHVDVLNYRPREGRMWINGPLSVIYRTQGPTIRPGGHVLDKGYYNLGAPAYLLFLRKSADGAYEPVSGFYDSAFSVKEMYAPLDESFKYVPPSADGKN